VSRVGVTTIAIECPLLQPAEQEQGWKIMTRSSRSLSLRWEHATRIQFDWHQRAFW